MRVFLAMVVAALLAACGGGGGDAGAPAPTASLALFAGSLQRAGSRDGVAAAAQFNLPEGVAQDSAGTIYVADTGNHTIRRITLDGTVSTLAGLAGQPGSADGAGAAARFSSPRAVALDAAGNLYVADTGNFTIRRIAPGGVVSTFAGAAGQSGAGTGAGALARFSEPTDLALDAGGNLYVGDGSVVRKITPAGFVTNFAGLPMTPAVVVGDGALARFMRVSGVAVDGAGNVIVSESPDGAISFVGRVRRFDSQGRALGWGSAADGVVLASWPAGLAADAAGNVYVASGGVTPISPGRAELHSAILRISPTGVIVTLAGRNNFPGSADGPGESARFQQPLGVAIGVAGGLVVADTQNHAIRSIDSRNIVSTVAGGAGVGHVDGPALAARFFAPLGLAAAADGTLFVADSRNRAVRRVSPAGLVSTLLATDATGAQAVAFNAANVAVGPDGTVYVVEFGAIFGRNVHALDSSGRSRLLDSAPGTEAIAADRFGSVYLAQGSQIVVIPRTGSKRILATGFGLPLALAVDAAGTVYVADAGDHTIRAVSPSGAVSLAAGRPGAAGYADGTLQEALFNFPRVLTLDAAGNLYVADNSNTIRKVSTEGRVTTLAGVAGQSGVQPGLLPAVLGRVEGLAWHAGALYATVQNAVMRIAPVN